MSLRLGGALWSVDALAWHEDDIDRAGHIAARPASTRPKKSEAQEIGIPERVYAKFLSLIHI